MPVSDTVRHQKGTVYRYELLYQYAKITEWFCLSRTGLNTPRITLFRVRGFAYCSRYAPHGPRSSDFGKLLFAEVT